MNTTFFAFASGKVSTESNEIKRYIGIAPVSILAVNPKKEELEKIYNTSLENEITYVNEVEVGEDKHKVKNVRLDFIVKTDAAKCDGIEMTTKVTFFLRKEARYNRDNSKVQVIDKYGRTCWVTTEQAKNHEIPMYANGPANIDADYRPCFVGEEELTGFIKNYLNIPNVMRYVNNTWVMVDNPTDCEARLECISDYFDEDFSELRAVIALQPENKVKVMFGVRENDGKQYQTFYSQMTLRNNESKYDRIKKDLESRKAMGAYPTTTFEVVPIKEYVVTATNFNAAPVVDDLPFGDTSASPWE